MAQDSAIESIVSGVHFADRVLRQQLGFDAGLGFLAVQSASERAEEVTVLGFAGTDVRSAHDMPPVLHSVTELYQLPPADQTVDKQGKGVGLRLYNTPHALAGLAAAPRMVAACALTVERDSVLDTRAPADSTLAGKGSRIARHFGRLVFARTENLAVLTSAIHQSYGDADAVLFNQPPRARLREHTRRARSPIPSSFMIVRNPHLPVQVAGWRERIE